MIADFLKRLAAPQTEPIDQTDARLALSALLVRVARTDGDYATNEIARIDRILAARYNLDTSAAQALRAEAEAVEASAPDTVRFTRAIKDAVAYEDRLAVIEALWQVALADGERDAEEDAIVRMVSSFLGVNDRDSALARQRVAQA
ncbi:TerB family tellurite resistance protein [Pseudohalocynthiibacter aestuariivivens]|uniref:TerB family tellurite resistance protein n=1 Tax=Roseovarius pelagicus TaxID=2980108 RepID=A0ABY6DD27_9RHOB|nr:MULTISPECIES: TerB family tellurite resistance protein [Rhodobacterales]QIE44054.1 TerB family tellurite resistance protein [Pseudohalocynthiibacter aestuariivivens]UXX84047.1 TerB family tellurite resistance protein [Roseovarius pelagicus]